MEPGQLGMNDTSVSGWAACGLRRSLTAMLRWPRGASEVLICISLANLWFLRSWTRIPEARDFSFVVNPPTFKSVCAVACLVLATAALLWILRRWLARRQYTPLLIAGRAALVLHTGLPFVFQLNEYPRRMAVLALTILALAVWWTRVSTRYVEAVLLIAAPLFLVELGLATRITFRGSPHLPAQLTPAGHKPPAVSPRIVWLIFDELDQSLLFPHRPGGVRLPEFDRFRSEAFYASDAESAGKWTYRAIPALTTSQAIVNSRPGPAGGIEVRPKASRDFQAWQDMPNIFSGAHELGLSVAVVGWYLPYCTTFERDLNYCYVAPHDDATDSIRKLEVDRTLPFSTVLYDVLREDAAAFRVSTAGAVSQVTRRELEYIRQQHRDAFLTVHERALRIAADDAYSLVLIHLPVPHPPRVQELLPRQRGSKQGVGYLDNLELADQVFGELRQAMEAAKVWDRSIVLATGDHGFRSSMWRQSPDWSAEDELITGASPTRVPFLLKLPFQHHEVVYSRHFSTVLTRDLLMALLTRRINGESGLAQWFDQHAGR